MYLRYMQLSYNSPMQSYCDDKHDRFQRIPPASASQAMGRPRARGGVRLLIPAK